MSRIFPAVHWARAAWKTVCTFLGRLGAQRGGGRATTDVVEVHGDEVVGADLRLLAGEQFLSGNVLDPEGISDSVISYPSVWAKARRRRGR
jgi:hypothetical protein